MELYYFWLIVAGILFFGVLNYLAYCDQEIKIYKKARIEITEEMNKDMRRRSMTQSLVAVVMNAALIYLVEVGLSPLAEKVFGFMIMLGVIWIIYKYMKRKST